MTAIKASVQVKSGAKRLGAVIVAVFRRLRGDDALLMAAGLSYTSLLSLVPLMTIGLAILAAFPAFEAMRHELQTMLLSILVPEVGMQVRQAIGKVVGNAGNLTAFGIVGLVVTSVLLLVTIEDALNRIFRVDVPRSPLSRLMVYWTVVTLGPLLLAASLSVTDWLVPALSPHVTPILLRLWAALANLFRSAMLVALFTLLYATVPNCRVSKKHALWGGLLAAAIIALLRVVFPLYVSDMHGYQTVYGALAAIPILLFWMYLVWVAVLIGAELTATLMEQRGSAPE